MQIAPIADINLLITDKHILKKDLDDFQLAGLTVSVAEEI
jgi:hypothetical protein